MGFIAIISLWALSPSSQKAIVEADISDLRSHVRQHDTPIFLIVGGLYSAHCLICLIWGFFAVACVCCDHFVCVCCLCDMPGFLISLFSSLYSSWFISLYSHLFIPRGFISLYSHLFISHLSIPISLFCWGVSRKWCFTPPPFPLNVTLNVVPEISQLRFAHRAVSTEK